MLAIDASAGGRTRPANESGSSAGRVAVTTRTIDGVRVVSIAAECEPWVKVGDVVAASGAVNRAIVERLHAAGIEYPDYVQEIRMLGGGD